MEVDDRLTPNDDDYSRQLTIDFAYSEGDRSLIASEYKEDGTLEYGIWENDEYELISRPEFISELRSIIIYQVVNLNF